MKRTTLLKTMLLLCALVAGSSSVWADVDVLSENFESQTGLPEGWAADAKGGGSTSGASAIYSGTDAHGIGSGKAQGKAWKLGTNSNPYGSVTTCELTTLSGNATLTFWARGKSGKSPVIEISGTDCTITGDGTSTTTSGSVATGTIDGSNYTQYTVNISGGSATSTITFRHAGPSDAGSYIYIDDIVITMPAEKTDPTITFNDGNVRVGKTLDLSTLFSSNSSGTVTYSITVGDSYASLDGSILTGDAEGSVTVQVSQAATGAYNAKTATATITVNAALALSSIAITTAPTKTTYSEGEIFDATGMIVTATYSDESTDNITALCTWTPSGALTTADDKITVSYTENETTKTATQDITVNAYVQPTSVTIQMTNSLFGEEVHTSGKSTEEMTFVGTQDRVTVTYYVPNDSYYYFNTSNTRPYDTGTIDYAAPSGYVITKIVFTSDGSNWKTATPSVGSMTETKQWEGAASNVTFSWSESGTRIKTVVITLAEAVPVTISSAEYATYVNATKDLDFSATGITVYTATGGTTSVTLNEVASGKVPANTPVVLYKSGADGTAVNVPVAASADAIAGTNDLAVSDGTVEGNGSTIYALAKKSGVVGFYLVKDGESIPSGKAYLTIASGGAPEFLGFSFGETTDLSEKVRVNSEKFATAPVYNLNGQRVVQPTKGLYILNGRKVVIK